MMFIAFFSIAAGCNSSEEKILVAHRGASAYRPEHTLPAYELGIDMGADFIEQDLHLSKDGVLVCLHDSTLERTTNVEEVFPERFRTEDGEKKWYVIDFTLDELKQLDAGGWFGEEFKGEQIPTFAESIELVKGRAGIFPEIKNPELYGDTPYSVEELFLAQLVEHSLLAGDSKSPTPVIVQSFDAEALRSIRKRAPGLSLVFLIGTQDSKRWVTSDGLKKISEFANGIGPVKTLIDGDPQIVERAHREELIVVPYTFRSGDVLAPFENVRQEITHFLNDFQVDGVFTDNPDMFPR